MNIVNSIGFILYLLKIIKKDPNDERLGTPSKYWSPFPQPGDGVYNIGLYLEGARFFTLTIENLYAEKVSLTKI